MTRIAQIESRCDVTTRTRDRASTSGGAAQPRSVRDGGREHKSDIGDRLCSRPPSLTRPGRFAAGAGRLTGQSAYIRVICG